MDVFIERLLQSSDVIVVLGLVIGVLYRMFRTERKDFIAYRKLAEKKQDKLHTDYGKKLEASQGKLDDLHVYVRDHDMEFFKAIDRLSDNLEGNKNN